jgi:flagellin-like protein
MKGVSPLVSSVIVILIVLALAAFIGPWLISLTQQVSDDETRRVEQELICRQTSYDFDSDYGNGGITWNFTNTTGVMSAKIINTGNRNIYNFTYELVFTTSSGQRIVTYPDVNITQDSQKTKANPLKAGQSWILNAALSSINDTWTLNEVKILNVVCPQNSPSVEL